MTLADNVSLTKRNRDRIEQGSCSPAELVRIAQESLAEKWQLVHNLGPQSSKKMFSYLSTYAIDLVLLRMAALIELGKTPFGQKSAQELMGGAFAPAMFREFRKYRHELTLWHQIGDCYFHDNELGQGSSYSNEDSEMIQRAVKRYCSEMLPWKEWSPRVHYSEQHNIYSFCILLEGANMREADHLLHQHFGEPSHLQLSTELTEVLKELGSGTYQEFQPVYYHEFRDRTRQVVIDRYHQRELPLFRRELTPTQREEYFMYSEFRRTGKNIPSDIIQRVERRIHAEYDSRRHTTLAFFNIPFNWSGSTARVGLQPLLEELIVNQQSE